VSPGWGYWCQFYVLLEKRTDTNIRSLKNELTRMALS
jgi:hypothetical protein